MIGWKGAKGVEIDRTEGVVGQYGTKLAVSPSRYLLSCLALGHSSSPFKLLGRHPFVLD
jgi:hypothetical protein